MLWLYFAGLVTAAAVGYTVAHRIRDCQESDEYTPWVWFQRPPGEEAQTGLKGDQLAVKIEYDPQGVYVSSLELWNQSHKVFVSASHFAEIVEKHNE